MNLVDGEACGSHCDGVLDSSGGSKGHGEGGSRPSIEGWRGGNDGGRIRAPMRDGECLANEFCERQRAELRDHGCVGVR